MKKRSLFLIYGGMLLAAVLVAGCLVSGTFIIVDDFEFTAANGIYHYTVDLTDSEAWKNHKDEIDMIDAVGTEFFITSVEPDNVHFSVWVDNFNAGNATAADVEANATPIIEDLTVPPGTTHITYAQSLGLIKNVDKLKALAKTGKFEFYGTSSIGNLGTSFVIDSGKVIVTFSASGS